MRRSTEEPRSPLLVPVAASLAVTVLAAVFVAVKLVTAPALPVLGWAFPVAASLAAAWACLRTSGLAGLTPGAALFWRRLGITLLVIEAAFAANVRDVLSTPGDSAPNPSPVTLVLFGLATTVGILTVLRLPGLTARARVDPGRFRFDAAIVVLTTALFVWHLSYTAIGAVASGRGKVLSGLILLLAGSVIVLVFAKIALTGPGPVDPVALRLLAAGTLVAILQGALSPLVPVRHDLAAIMLGYPLAVLFFTVAGWFQARAVRRTRTAAADGRRRGASLLPYVAVVATDLLLLATRGDGPEPVVVAAFVVALTALVVWRQITALRENERLVARLDAAQERLAHAATHDTVTGLANRALFEERVREALDGDEPATLALIDLDDFKQVNDRHGHLAGDEVLRVTAERLSRVTRAETADDRPADTVARLGGDEFAVLLRGVTEETAGRILDRVRAAVLEPVVSDGEHLRVGVSIGLAAGWPGADPRQLIRRADLAMYAAKGSGKGRLTHYRSDLEQQDAARARLAADLRTALMQQQFRLDFQPIVRLADGAVVAAEALVRWDHPERGLVPPAEFVPIAERTELIVPIGAWILAEACQQAAAWPGDVTLSVNVAGRQLREPGFPELVTGCLEATGLPASRLMIEVTEASAGDTASLDTLAALAGLGVRIALDGFGAGQTSLALLRHTVAHTLKVDRTFLADLAGPAPDTVIMSALLHLADGRGLRAVAKGVETAEQAERLHGVGYRYAQGFHLGRPVPGPDLMATLAGTHEIADAGTFG